MRSFKVLCISIKLICTQPTVISKHLFVNVSIVLFQTAMWKKFSLRGNYKWLDILPELITLYNNRKHRTIGMKPKDVTKTNTSQVLQNFTEKRKPMKKSRLKLGDKVRISRIKNVFEKGYIPNWTTEIFAMTRLVYTNPTTYHLKDYRDKPI